jgi:hypothetical protein
MQTQWGKLYANFQANAKPLQAMALLGFKLFFPALAACALRASGV